MMGEDTIPHLKEQIEGGGDSNLKPRGGRGMRPVVLLGGQGKAPAPFPGAPGQRLQMLWVGPGFKLVPGPGGPFPSTPGFL